MLRRLGVVVLAIMLLACFSRGQARAAEATTNGTADGSYDFGSLGSADSAGLGYAKLGDKFKVANQAFSSWPSLNSGVLTAINPDSDTTALHTAVIKAEGGATCKTFTFKDLGISATDTAQSFHSLTIVLRDMNGTQIGSAISLGSSAAYSMSSITNISALYGQAPWSVNGVASVEITYALDEDGSPAPAWDLNLEYITVANISAPPGPPILFGLSPSSGAPSGGAVVTITGADFTGATSVTFGGTNAAGFTVDSPTQITAVSPASPVGKVDIIVNTPLGLSAPSNQFTYSNTADGTHDFGGLGPDDSMGPGTGYARLGDKFKTRNSKYVQWQSHNTGPFTAIFSNTNDTAPYTAVIETEGGATCKSFTFKDLGVSATYELQSFGSCSLVFKDANGIQIGSAVSLGSSPVFSATSVTNLSAIYSQGPWSIDDVAAIEMTYTLHTNGSLAEAGDLNLENLTISKIAAPPGPPAVLGIYPSVGPTSGGTEVILTGADFSGATGVKFGNSNAVSFTVEAATRIRAISPPGPAGQADVSVVTPLGTSAAGHRFTYSSTADGTYHFGNLGADDSMGPGTGYARLGDKFKVRNALFTQWQSHNTGTPTAIVPNSNATSPYTEVIEAEGGDTCKTFTFRDLGVSATTALQAFSSLAIVLKDATGSQIGSTIALGTSAVYPATSVTSVSSLYSRAPWSVDGVAAVEITYALKENGTPAAAWDLNLENITVANVSAPAGPPGVFGISPSSGPRSGGTAVTITGSDFTGATAVQFGGTNAAGFSVDSSTRITAAAPAGTAGTVEITVTTPLGTSAARAVGQFTYLVTNQTISFSAVPDLYTGATATVGATATSGLPVTLSSLTPGTCTVNGTQVTAVAAGTCTIAADQGGNANFNPAPQVTLSRLVSTVPGPPTSVSATAGDAQALVSFNAPVDNGGNSITSYTVTSSPGGITAVGVASPIPVTGLTNGTGYSFTVTASNVAGPGPVSPPSPVVTPTASATRDGILNRASGKTAPDIGDALLALQYTLGLTALDEGQRVHADVAPLGPLGTPRGNGTVDTADVIMILRRCIGVGSW